MLLSSIENNPSDPPCSSSSNFSGLKNDERVSSSSTTPTVVALEERVDLLNPSSLVDDNHLPSFSIRDYAFKSRSKGIEKSWPFPQEYLQVCLKSGHKVPLPSFEPPDLIKNNTETSQTVPVNSNNEVNIGSDGESQLNESSSSLPVDESVKDIPDQTQSIRKEQEKTKEGLSGTVVCRLSTIPDLDEIGEEGFRAITSDGDNIVRAKASSRAATEIQVNPRASQKNIIPIELESKKSKSIEKVGLSDTHGVEDIVSNTTTISEPMASQACPVCKTFLSTSNTTLNAHIDQCLVEPSTLKTTKKSRLSTHKIKPTQYKTMADIYSRAKPCTLEELDERNGTNWASDLSSPIADLSLPAVDLSSPAVDLSSPAADLSSPAADLSSPAADLSSPIADLSSPIADLSSPIADLSSPTADAEVRADGKRKRVSGGDDFEDTNIGSAVYFDSNGTKLRILSRLDDSSVPRSGENSKSKKHKNEDKESNMRLNGKMKHLGAKDTKHQKFKSHKKKLLSLKSNVTKVPGVPGRNNGLDENCEKEDLPSGLSKGSDSANHVKLGQWVCAKRTDMLKKPNEKHARRGLLMKRDPSIRSNQSNVSHSSTDTRYVQEFLKPSESPNLCQKADKEKFPKRKENLNLSDKNHTSPMHSRSMIKFSRSSQSHASSSRSKRSEIQNNENFEGEGSPKRRMTNQPKNHNRILLGGQKRSAQMDNVMSDESSKPNLNDDGNRCPLTKSRIRRCMRKAIERAGKMRQDVDQIRLTRKFDRKDKFINEDMPRNEAYVYERGTESSRSLGMRSYEASQGFEVGIRTSTTNSGAGTHSGNSMAYASEEVRLNGVDTIMQQTQSDTEYTSRRPISRSCESLMPVFRKACALTVTQPNCLQSFEQNERHLSDVQASYSAKSISNNPEGREDVDYRVGGKSRAETAHTDCGDETISIPGPPGFFLPSPGDISSEVHFESSSLTSNKLPSSRDRSLMVDRDSSESPLSATSTISQLRIAMPEASMEPNSLVGPPRVLENLGLGGDNTAFSSAKNVQIPKRINSEMESIKTTKESLVEESMEVSDDPPCQCSRKERMPWDDSLTYQDIQLLRQRNLAPSVPTLTKAPLNNNPILKPEVSASSSGFSSSNFNQRAVRELDLPNNSDALKTSSYGAHKARDVDDFGSAKLSQQVPPVPSNSNPVLRLMGKTFMVVNKVEDSSSKLKESPPVDPDPNYSILPGFSTANMTSENGSSLYRMASDGSVIFNHDIYNPLLNRFDNNLPNTPGSCSSSGNQFTNSQSLAGNHGYNHQMGVFPMSFPNASSQPQEVNYSDNHHMRNFPSSLLSNGSNNMNGRFQTLQDSLPERSNSLFRYNDGRSGIATSQANQSPASAGYVSANPMNELIALNGSPENEADLSRNYTEESRRRHISSPFGGGGFLPSSQPSPNLRQVNDPFYSHRSVDNSFQQRESLAGTYPMLCPRGNAGSPAKPGSNSVGPVYRRPIL